MADTASTPAANLTLSGDLGATIQWGTATISGVATGAPAKPGLYGGNWTLQVSGTYGGATWTFQGSNDAVTWFTLNDVGGTPLTYAVADKLLNVKERPKFVRIITAAGTGTALVAILAVSDA